MYVYIHIYLFIYLFIYLQGACNIDTSLVPILYFMKRKASYDTLLNMLE